MLDKPLMAQIQPTKASIETCTACNHSCVYCPVSEFPQKQEVMPLELFRHAIDELESLNRHLRRISFNHYNETLLDPYLVSRVRIAIEYSFFDSIWIFSHLGSMPDSLPRDLEFAKERILFHINLPTAIRERYKELHGVDHLPAVEENIAKLASVGLRMKINIQKNFFTTQEDLDSVMEKFGSKIPVRIVESNSRGGLVKDFQISGHREERLAGCSLDNRPTDYVHIGVNGEVFLCCQDFFKQYRLGDLRHQSLREIISSPPTQEYLGYVFGVEEAPADFICKSCEFARHRSKERQ